MKVKIGDNVYEAGPNMPVMVILDENDKKHLTNSFSDPNFSKYAEFDDECGLSTNEMYDWMNEPIDIVHTSEVTIEQPLTVNTLWSYSKPLHDRDIVLGHSPVMAYPLYNRITSDLVGITYRDPLSGVTSYEVSATSLEALIERKRVHSQYAYGDIGYEDILSHVLREVEEVRVEPWNTEEWIDIVLLGLDGAWRSSRYKNDPHDHHSGHYVTKVLISKFNELMDRFSSKIHKGITEVVNLEGYSIDHENKVADSAPHTYKHRQLVQTSLYQMISDLYQRGLVHDQSKFEEPEKSALDKFQYVLETQGPVKFGTPEYINRVGMLKTDIHHKKNRHHPEFFLYGIVDMTLVDLVEMLCDWRAACHRDGVENPTISLSAMCDRYKIDDQLRYILENTCRKYDWNFK